MRQPDQPDHRPPQPVGADQRIRLLRRQGPGVAQPASENPYKDVVRGARGVSSREAPAPPAPAVFYRALDGVLSGRNLPELSAHWRDMMSSLEARNASLHRSVRLLERAEAAGLADAAGAANTDSPPLLYGPKEALAYALHGLLPALGTAQRAMAEAAASLPPGWAPKSMLDFGAGAS